MKGAQRHQASFGAHHVRLSFRQLGLVVSVVKMLRESTHVTLPVSHNM